MNIVELENNLKEEDDKAGVYPIYTNKQGVLLVYLMIPSNKKYGGISPQMGKGGVDPGETVQQAAIREGFEELGLREDNIVSIKSISDHLHISRKTIYNLSVFVATVKDPNNFDTPGYESGWAGWMPIDDAIVQTRPEQVQFLQQIKQDYTVTLTKESAQTVIQDKINKYQDAVGHYDKMIKQDGDVHILRKEIETTKAEISNLNAQLQLAAQDSEHDGTV